MVGASRASRHQVCPLAPRQIFLSGTDGHGWPRSAIPLRPRCWSYETEILYTQFHHVRLPDL